MPAVKPDTPAVEPERKSVSVDDLLAKKKALADTVECTFEFTNWDGEPASMDFTLRRPVFAQGFGIGLEEAGATAAQVTQKWLRGDDRSEEPKEAYAQAFFVAKELVASPKIMRTQDGVLALPPAARTRFPDKLCEAVGLGPKVWAEMRGDSDTGAALEELLRQLNLAASSAVPQPGSDETSGTEKSGSSSPPPEPTDSGSDGTPSSTPPTSSP
jgi:hypothetical protein